MQKKMKKEQYLKEGNILFTAMILISCSKEVKQRANSMDYASEYQTQNFHKYKNVYDVAYDALDNWNENGHSKLSLHNKDEYLLDSAIVFNHDTTRLYGAIIFRGSFYSVGDYAEEFYGAKINSRWYFLTGGGLHIPRVFYQDSMYAPMTFKELSYVAHVNFIQNYLIKKSDGSFEGDDERINKYILNSDTYGCYHCTTKEQNDSLFLAKVYENNAKRKSQAEIDKILEEATATRRPLEPPIDPKTGHGHTAWTGKTDKESAFNDKVYYPKDTIDGPHPFYKKRNWWQKYWYPFEPRIFGRKNEDDAWL